MGPGAVGREIGAEVPFPFSPSSVLSPRVTPPILPMNPPSTHLITSQSIMSTSSIALLVLGFTSLPRLAENWSVVKFIWRDSSYGSNSMFQSKTHNRPNRGRPGVAKMGRLYSLSESVCSLTTASKLWLIKDNNRRISHRALNRTCQQTSNFEVPPQMDRKPPWWAQEQHNLSHRKPQELLFEQPPKKVLIEGGPIEVPKEGPHRERPRGSLCDLSRCHHRWTPLQHLLPRNPPPLRTRPETEKTLKT